MLEREQIKFLKFKQSEGLDPDGFDKLTTGEFDEDTPSHEDTDGQAKIVVSDKMKL